MAEALKEIIPFTYDEIEQKVKDLLLSKGFKDIEYPGSNISQISDIMTYLTHVLNTNTAINLQEVLLPLATKRVNVLFSARHLGYEPKRKTSYRYSLKINFKKRDNIADNEPYNFVLDKYTKFSSNGNDYYYMGDPVVVEGITNKNRFDKSFTIEVKEGTLHKYEDDDFLNIRAYAELTDSGSFTKQNYMIPYRDVEDDGIELFLTYVDDYGTLIEKEKWERYDSIMIDSTYDEVKKKFITLENIFLEMPSVFFEIGGIGNPVRINTLIQANVLVTKGKEGEAGEIFTAPDELKDQITVFMEDITHYGTDNESVAEIKENAMIYHNSANRAVTALDYKAIVKNHESVRYGDVWGSEEEFYNVFLPGNILFSLFPQRTIRELIPTPINSKDNAKDEYSANKAQFDLQYMPRRPKMNFLADPSTNPVARPIDYIPRPSNYVEKPVGWDDYAQGGVLPPAPTISPNPGEKPVIQYPPTRANYFADPTAGGGTQPQLPNDWIENPNISGTFDGVNPEPGLELIQDSTFVEIFNNYIKTIPSADANIYINNDQAWYDDESTHGLDDSAAGGSFGGSAGSGTLYKEWLTKPEVVKYITWLKEDYLYRTSLAAYTEWESNRNEFQYYLEFLNSETGIEYTTWFNSLNQVQQDEVLAYETFLSNVKRYSENKKEQDSILDNWYLRNSEIYKNPNTKIGDADGTIFSSLEKYKIMTMNHEYRQPAYCNFDFKVRVINYDVGMKVADMNQAIFDVIDSYFKNYIERLNTSYFSSNLKRRVDEVVGDVTGVEIDLTNDISLHKIMYDPFTALLYSQNINKIITKLAFPFENMFSNGLDFDGYDVLPNIDTDRFILGRTKFEVQEPQESATIGSGVTATLSVDDVIMVQEASIYRYYRSLEDRPSIDVDSENFNDPTKWVDLNTKQDVIKNDTFKVLRKGASEYEYLYINEDMTQVNIFYIIDSINGGFDSSKWKSTFSFNGADGNPLTLKPLDLYVKKNINGKYDVPNTFRTTDKFIEVPIYIGDTSDSNVVEQEVGSYIIRNERYQHIEVHLEFEDEKDDGQVIGLGKIPANLTFTDYGFGYMNLVYPNTVEVSSDNMPFTANTMPRLRQVKFL